MEQKTEMTAIERVLAKSGPRKLLALDGGGVRGMISIEVLARIERTLRLELGRGDDFVLADYFDYIGGTSIGAILATCLSLGLSVEQIRTFFLDNARDLFQRVAWWNRWRHAYRPEPVRKLLQKVIADAPPPPGVTANPVGHETLGSAKLRTLLMLVMRNATTDSPWPISNHPDAEFNRDPDNPECNLHIPLWQLVRASAAAPAYFPPEVLRLGELTFAFDDGGVTPFANPAFQLFLMATLPEYRLNWPAGEQQMLLVSVGTGRVPHLQPVVKMQGEHFLYHARSVPRILIGANVVYQDILCRVMGRCRVGDAIDAELGDLIDSPGGPVEPKRFTYLRYDTDLSAKSLSEMKLNLSVRQIKGVRRLDSVNYLDPLQAIGRTVAEKVHPDHFAGFLP